MSFSTINSFNSCFYKNSLYLPPPTNLQYNTANQQFTFTPPQSISISVKSYNVYVNGVFNISFSGGQITNYVPTLTGNTTIINKVLTTQKALSFNGSTQYCSINDPSVYIYTTGTIEVWFKSNTTNTGIQLIAGKDCMYGIFINNLLLSIYDWTTSSFTNVTTNVLDNNWHYAAFTFQSGVTNGSCIYIDGILKKTFTWTATSIYINLYLYIANSSVNQYFQGSVGHLRIWNISLTSTYIQTNWNQVLSSTTNGLVGIWNFSEGIGTTLVNGVNGSPNFTTFNSPAWSSSGPSLYSTANYSQVGTYTVSSSTTSLNTNGNIYQSFTPTGSYYWKVANTGTTKTNVIPIGGGTAQNVSGEWLQIQLPIQLQMTSFSMTSLSDSPSGLTIAGSNDGIIFNNVNVNAFITVELTGNYKLYSSGYNTFVYFYGNGTIITSQSIKGNVLLVAGGGAGGCQNSSLGASQGSGGGGAGGLEYGDINLNMGNKYNIVVGSGGQVIYNSLNQEYYGTNGGNTYITEMSNNYFVYGGGSGGSSSFYNSNSVYTYRCGNDGGCGGGAIWESSYPSTFTGNTVKKIPTITGLTILGNNSGTNAGGINNSGGGATTTGTVATTSNGTVGGAGYTWIDGNVYAGGGGSGGSASNGNGGTGGSGGGGKGGNGRTSSSANNGSSGTLNKGGGGGGAGSAYTGETYIGGNGGSGIVVFKFNTIIKEGSVTNNALNTSAYQIYRFICAAPLSGNVVLGNVNFSGIPGSFPLSQLTGFVSGSNVITLKANYGSVGSSAPLTLQYNST